MTPTFDVLKSGMIGETWDHLEICDAHGLVEERKVGAGLLAQIEVTTDRRRLEKLRVLAYRWYMIVQERFDEVLGLPTT